MQIDGLSSNPTPERFIWKSQHKLFSLTVVFEKCKIVPDLVSSRSYLLSPVSNGTTFQSRHPNYKVLGDKMENPLWFVPLLWNVVEFVSGAKASNFLLHPDYGFECQWIWRPMWWWCPLCYGNYWVLEFIGHVALRGNYYFFFFSKL